MIEPDTIKLLRECDAGIKMGTASIADVLDKVNDAKLKEMLENCKDQHEKSQIQWHRGCSGSKPM